MDCQRVDLGDWGSSRGKRLQERRRARDCRFDPTRISGNDNCDGQWHKQRRRNNLNRDGSYEFSNKVENEQQAKKDF
jgi:hypothetical protein